MFSTEREDKSVSATFRSRFVSSMELFRSGHRCFLDLTQLRLFGIQQIKSSVTLLWYHRLSKIPALDPGHSELGTE